jgi:4-hydroxy-4-methyl-2-oxoglutarate aldolase
LLAHPQDNRIINQTVRRPDASIISSIGRLYTGFVLDRMSKQGAMIPAIRPLSTGMKLFGPCVTCAGPDLSVRNLAINLAQQGDILVVAAGGSETRSCFGDSTAQWMQLKGLGGVIIDGMTRDAAGIRRLGFPTFCRGATARNFAYPQEPSVGAINVPVICGGQLVRPGDVALADDDGVLIIPAEIAEAAAGRWEAELMAEERDLRSRSSFEELPGREDLVGRGFVFR